MVNLPSCYSASSIVALISPAFTAAVDPAFNNVPASLELWFDVVTISNPLSYFFHSSSHLSDNILTFLRFVLHLNSSHSLCTVSSQHLLALENGVSFRAPPPRHDEHHHSPDDDEDERNRSPPHFPSPEDGPEPFQPPPGVHHVSHQPGAGFTPPPPFSEPPPPPFFDAPPPPRPSPVVDDPFHDSRHEIKKEEGCHRSGYSDNASHEGEGGSLYRQPTVRVFTKAEENYSLSIRDGKVILARQDPSDEYQHWIKDLRYSTKVKDEESFPAFALINKATGEAIKHSSGATHPFPEPKIVCNDPIPDSFLRTVVHNENEAYEQYCAYAHHIGFTVRKDHSSFWPNSKNIKTKDFICGKAGYKREPKFNNTVKFKRADTRTGCLAMIRYVVDVEGNWSVKKFIKSHNHPLAKSGDRHLLRSNRKIIEINAKRDIYNNSRYRHLEKTQMLSSSSSDLIFITQVQELAYQIITKAAGNEQAENYVLESFKKLSVDIDDILNGREPQSKQKSNKKKILNKERNLNDPTKMQPNGISNSKLKEYWEKNKRIKRNEKEACSSQDPVLLCDPLFAMSDCLSQVRLVPYNPNFLDESVLWTESRDLGDGFRCIRMVNNISLNFDAFNGDEQHGGVHDGTIIVLWEWLKGKNQRWKIVPY
ncbi:uncharacterized protein LOC110031142 [Phalaenopsis equestris]|uniref:uncharacterized protein LOC110031142 n=1 Tax=Phalaenopsis equestris TaxID=78828 RepID=UPI0009E44C59|nr:uncharacterized protein LOC110031142 [Phalaenopsis equestris]